MTGSAPEVFWYAPLYPYALGAAYATIGESILGIRLLQALIGGASCVALAIAGARWVSPRVGLVAGGMLALYAPALFYDALVHKPVLATLFLCALLAALGRSPGPQGRIVLGACFTAGLALGGLILTREERAGLCRSRPACRRRGGSLLATARDRRGLLAGGNGVDPRARVRPQLRRRR